MTDDQSLRRLAGVRQGVINMLNKRVVRLEAKLNAAEARLAMYDHREGL
jgi:acid phosphatase family membrane protein YuiD